MEKTAYMYREYADVAEARRLPVPMGEVMAESARGTLRKQKLR